MKFNFKYCFLYQDNFNIYNLIRKINADYRLYFNSKDKIYFIVNIAKNYEICFKFYNFNTNILKNLQYSKIENSLQIFREIDNFNLMTELKNKKSITDSTTLKIAEIANVSKRLNHLSSNTVNKIIGADLC